MRSLPSISLVIRWWMPSTFNPYRSCLNDILIIKPQSHHRYSTCGCESSHMSSTVNPNEVLRPSLSPRIKKRYKLARFRIDGMSFRSLEFIAAITRCRQIFTLIRSSNRSRKNMFDDWWCSSQSGGSLAVFATVICFDNNLLAQFF